MMLVNGCSFSQGEQAWPNHLHTFDQSNIVNLSCSSAGNTYIHEATVNALSIKTFDIIVIMWSGLTRIDTKVANIGKFDNSCYNSRFASAHNDWPSKITSPVDDQDFVDKDWVFGLGEQNQDPVVKKSQLFRGFYQHLESSQFVFHFLIKLISLQNTLKTLKVPYIFSFYQPYQNTLQQFSNLCKLVDWDNVYTEKNIFELAKANNDIDSTNHPGTATHKQWAKIMDELIDKKLTLGRNI
jgi:hypothetical protein